MNVITIETVKHYASMLLPMQEFLNSYILNQNMKYKMFKGGPPAAAQWGGSYRKKW